MNISFNKNTKQRTTNKDNSRKKIACSLFMTAILLLSTITIATSFTTPVQIGAQKSPSLAVINSGGKPTIDNLKLEPGYKIEPIFWNLTLPSAATFDDKGNMYIAQSGFGEWFFATPSIIKVDQNGNTSILVDRMIFGPVTDVEFYKGKLYVSHKGVISTVDPVSGVVKDIIIGLPSSGDHQNNQIAFGPDGKIYFGQGTATNSAIVGEDNIYGLQWPKYTPKIHDIPGKNITLTGQNFETPNAFTGNRTNATTGAYSAYDETTRKDQVIRGDVKCNGCIIRANPDGTEMEIVAWGLRNPYGVAFTNNGTLIISNNGADERGSRNIANDTDNTYSIDVSKPENLGKFYGWPDFAGNGEPVTDPKFESPRNKQPLQFLLQEHPEVVKPLAQIQIGPSLTQNAFSNGSKFGHEGMMFIGASGTFTPITHTTGHIDKGVVGHKIYMVNPKNGTFSEFLTVKSDPSSFTPVGLEFSKDGSTLYIADLGKLELRDTLPNGTPLNNNVTWPYPYTGVIWKVTPPSS